MAMRINSVLYDIRLELFDATVSPYWAATMYRPEGQPESPTTASATCKGTARKSIGLTLQIPNDHMFVILSSLVLFKREEDYA